MIPIKTLQTFCGTDDTRTNLYKPFSSGEWTYATDGKILIRVPRMLEVPEIAEAPAELASKAFDFCEFEGEIPLQSIEMPPAWFTRKETCSMCGGSKLHGCDCGHTHECLSCDGTGECDKHEEATPVTIGAGLFASHLYLNRLKTLKEVFIAPPKWTEKPKPFGIRFKGGVGRLMGMCIDFPKRAA